MSEESVPATRLHDLMGLCVKPATRLTSRQVFAVVKALRPHLPIEYHESYTNDHAMRGMPQIILNDVQLFTPRHASLLADTRIDYRSEDMLKSGRLESRYALTLLNIEEHLSGSRCWSKYGNQYLTHGCDRCDCGCKYWVNDTCQSCGFEFDYYQHRQVAPQVNTHEACEGRNMTAKDYWATMPEVVQ